MTIRSASAILLAVAPLLIGGWGGCVTDGPVRADPPKPHPMPREITHPVAISVSPLTRVGVEGIAGPAIFLHLEFRDAAEQNIKAFGRLHVELSDPSAASPDAKAQPIRKSWDTDLTDPLRNALSFDEMITRTYTVTLTGIPDWLVHWSRREGDQTNAPAPTIIVQYAPSDSNDPSHILRVAYTLTR